jgi:hypothetical protein
MGERRMRLEAKKCQSPKSKAQMANGLIGCIGLIGKKEKWALNTKRGIRKTDTDTRINDKAQNSNDKRE